MLDSEVMTIVQLVQSAEDRQRSQKDYLATVAAWLPTLRQFEFEDAEAAVHEWLGRPLPPYRNRIEVNDIAAGCRRRVEDREREQRNRQRQIEASRVPTPEELAEVERVRAVLRESDDKLRAKVAARRRAEQATPAEGDRQ